MSKKIIAKYEIESKDLKQAAHDICIGQSIGNPSRRTAYDNELGSYVPTYRFVGQNVVEVAFPASNFGKDFHINYMMSVLMGGQMDIDHITKCRLVDLDLEDVRENFPGPRYGIEGIRKMIGVHGRPLVGGIIKPKIGLSIIQLCDVVKQMADGGVDFIKEDEILNFQEWCPMEERVHAVSKVLEGYNVIYAPCCTADDPRFPLHKVKAIHINWWCGLGHYRIMRLHVPYAPAIFFQKSGDKVITTGPYSIDYAVICKLVNWVGCDFAHVGMLGGYMDEGPLELRRRVVALGNTLPSFSCGATPESVEEIHKLFGNDIMVTSGGYIHSYQHGITKAVQQFRRACEKVQSTRV